MPDSRITTSVASRRCRMFVRIGQAAILIASGVASLDAQQTEKALENYQLHLFFENSIYKPSAGSLFAPNAFLADAARDPRASQVGDLISVMPLRCHSW